MGKTKTDVHRSALRKALDAYWFRNLLILRALLLVWAVAGLGCGVLFADRLNEYHFFNTGYPLGFWFAHQGSIIVFVLVILVYCLSMNALDRKHHREIEIARDQERAEDPS
jgi:putative solute:sodium symporter small subunit